MFHKSFVRFRCLTDQPVLYVATGKLTTVVTGAGGLDGRGVVFPPNALVWFGVSLVVGLHPEKCHVFEDAVTLCD